MYQKHDEKGSRLDNLWNSKKDKIDIDGIDPEELKFSLIKDPTKRADLYIKEKTAEFRQKQKIAESTSDKIFKMAGERKDLISEVAKNQKEIEKMRTAIADFTAKTDTQIIAEYDLDFENSYSRSIYEDYGSARGANIKELRENYIKSIKENIADSQKTIGRAKGKLDTIDNTLKRYEIDDAGNMAAIERVRKRYSDEAIGYKSRIETIEKNRDQYIKDAAEKIKLEARPGVSVFEAVEENTASVSRNLYSIQVVKDKKAAQEAEAGIQKSIFLLLPKKIKVRVRG